MADEERRIGGLPPISISRNLFLAAEGAGGTGNVTTGDVADLVDAAHIAALVTAAPAKAVIADADMFALVDSAASNAPKKATLADLITSIFKVTRTIANAHFAAASFRLFNAAGTPRSISFDAAALTADRTITMPDRDVAFTSTEIDIGSAIPTTSGVAIDVTGIAAGTTIIILDFSGVRKSGSDQLWLQIGDAGGFETSGYSSGGLIASTGGAASIAPIANAFYLANPGAASSTFDGAVILSLQDAATNAWTISGSLYDAVGSRFHGIAGGKSLSQPLDRLRLTSSAGVNTFAAGKLNYKGLRK
jgi:hypothetical protein